MEQRELVASEVKSFQQEAHLRSWCESLPKVELHAHLNGSLRESTIKELLEAKSKTNSNFNSYSIPPTESRTLQQCFDLFSLIHKLTTNEEVIARITSETIEDFAKDNVKYLELRTTPRNVERMTKRSYVETVVSIIEKSKQTFGIPVGLLLSINREETREQALETVQLAAEFSNRGVCGIDLSGNPHVGNVESWIPALEYAKKMKLPLSLHVAEVYNPEETKKLLSFQPDRIGHAVFLDDSLKSFLRANPIPLELSLTSNVKTKSVDRYANHHFKQFYEDGYPIALCTDDKGVFCTSLSAEYAIAAREFKLSTDELYQLSLKSIDYIFASEEVKKELRQSWKNPVVALNN